MLKRHDEELTAAFSGLGEGTAFIARIATHEIPETHIPVEDEEHNTSKVVETIIQSI